MVVGSWPFALGVGGEAEGEGEYEWDEWFHCVFELDSCCLDIVFVEWSVGVLFFEERTRYVE